MRILIFDSNRDRTQSLKERLAGHTVLDKRHIDGTNAGGALLSEAHDRWTDRLKQAVTDQVNESELIILHISNPGAEQALQNLYQDKYVIAFSGGGISTLQGCNPDKHCFIKEPIGGSTGTWSELWCRRIHEFISVLEAGHENFALAREKITGFNHKLEENLDKLYAALERQIDEPNMEELIRLREDLLRPDGGNLS